MSAQTTEQTRARAVDEVVTRALVRDLDLPGGAGRMALITLDNGRDHTRPTTFGPQGLASLDAALQRCAERAAAGEIVAVGLTGKPYVFCAGADLSVLGSARTRDDAVAIARRGHEVFGRLSSLGVPSFAFVNGVALGGGMEVALHCTYRTASASAQAMGLPECFLGLIPGWGGTYLLSRLVGPEAALQVIVANPLNNNRRLDAREAGRLGVVDAVFDAADFLESSLDWAARVLLGTVAVPRPGPPAPGDDVRWEAAVAHARETVDARVHGAAPAPYRALELIRLARTADAEAAFEAENQAIADLIMSDQLRASLYAFDLINRRARRPAGVPSVPARPVTGVGVVGAGLMASQLALLFARRLQVPVVMIDVDDARVAKGLAAVDADVGSLLDRRRLSPDAANRVRALVTGSTRMTALAGADLVIEAVYEELAVKREVLAGVEAVVGPECVLMTNTSSLSVTEMAAGLAHPERLAGFHFFNPVAVMPLVEVVRTAQTDDTTLATAFAVGRELRKSCVLVGDAPGFVVNRLLFRFMGEVLRAVDDGTPAQVADEALAPLGLPMSPLVLLQLVGPAVALHVARTMHAAFPDRFAVSPTLERMAAGDLSPGEEGSDSAAGPSTQQIRERALVALAEEVTGMLEGGVVGDVRDLDLCMLLGAGWPLHLGGISPYLDRLGYSERVAGRRFLPPGVASLP